MDFFLLFLQYKKKKFIQEISLKSTSGTLNKKDWISFYYFSNIKKEMYKENQITKYFWHFKSKTLDFGLRQFFRQTIFLTVFCGNRS